MRCVLIFCILFSRIYGQDAREKIKQIPIEDRRILSDFFKGMLSQGDFASVLFGEKPASSHLYHAPVMFDFEFTIQRSTYGLLEHQGWKTWWRYKDFFSQTLYTFVGEIRLDEEYKTTNILFINQKLFREIIEKHPSIEGFIHDRFNQKSLPAFFMHGTLFGYPKEDISAFMKRAQIGDTLAFFPYETEEPIYLTDSFEVKDLLDGDLENLNTTYKYMKKNLQARYSWDAQENPLFCSRPYRIMSLSSSIEKPNIKDLKQRIIDLYNSDHFLEEFLDILEGK